MKTKEYFQKWTAWHGRCRAAYPYTFCGGEEQSYDNVGKWFQTLHDKFLTKYAEAYQQQVDRVGVTHEDPCNLIHSGLDDEPDAMKILLETMRELNDLETTGQ